MAVLSHEQPHFVVFPFMAQGHTIPMIDIARMLSQRGAIVTILTTRLNSIRFNAIVARAIEAGLKIHTVHLNFPCTEAGLPEGCENVDMLPSMDKMKNFFGATQMLQPQVEQLVQDLEPSPTCMISDMCFPWTIPGLPDKIELTRAQLKGLVDPSNPEWKEIGDQMKEAENESYGIVVNSFEELEPQYVQGLKKSKGKKVWTIGPVSLCNKEKVDKAERGNKAAIDEHYCIKWLNSQEQNSVLFVCLGSLSRLPTSQMIELGLGLELSERPFIWVIKHMSDEFRKWLQDENFDERVSRRGTLIHGWAPQVLILSHPSVGGFLTHCGWNSSIEGISAGVPMITCPLFAEQFCNERLIINVLKTGVKGGMENPVVFLEEEKAGTQVNKDGIKMVIERVMGEGEEARMIRKRAKEYGEMAKMAVEEGGSSYVNLTKLIQDVIEQANYEVKV